MSRGKLSGVLPALRFAGVVMFRKLLGACVGLAMMGVAGTADAALIGYDISWTGSGGYSMTGMFGFDDLLLNTGAIDETDIDSRRHVGCGGGDRPAAPGHQGREACPRDPDPRRVNPIFHAAAA